MIYGRWTHRTASTIPPPRASRIKRTVAYHYDAVLPPTTPVRRGHRAQICLLSDTRYHTPSFAGTLTYDAYDTGITGEVQGIVAETEHTVVLLVRNEHTDSPVTYAFISIPNLPGETVRLGADDWVLPPPGHVEVTPKPTRLERSAMIAPRPAHGPTPRGRGTQPRSLDEALEELKRAEAAHGGAPRKRGRPMGSL